MPKSFATEPARGLAMVELLVSMALGLLVLGAAVVLLRQGVDISHTVTQRAEMQQNDRVAVNLLTRDLSIAGTGIPSGGIALPSGAKSVDTRRGCSTTGNCGLLGFFVNDHLYSITPGNGLGPTINGIPTDAVTLVFIDDSLLGRNPLKKITPSGSQITVDPADVPVINDPANGLKLGDILMLSNTNGAALGLITNVQDDKVLFSNGDPLNINQPSAAFGNIASLANPSPPGPAGQYPPTQAVRINVVSFFIDASNPNEPRLMRQVNANPAVPVALHVENLQISYDIMNTGTGAATADLASPADPNQVRKVNLAVSVRSPRQGLFGRSFERLTLTTSVSVRNLGWFDRYPG